MTTGRVEPYQRALNELRERLRTGALAPGGRVNAKDLAEELGLSPTPVREAMARLSGERLLEERRGDGFFARTLTAADIEDLYRLSQAILLQALEEARRVRTDVAAALDAQVATDPVRAVERLFLAWVADAHSPVFLENYRLLIFQLGPVRRMEHHLLGDLTEEARNLVALAGSEEPEARRQAIESFHARRFGLAEPLSEHLASPSTGSV
jgi:DNA-binding GntR family transcriptional regulator